MIDSEIRWIGQIPPDWKLLKLGSLFNLRNEKVSDKDYPPLSVSRGGVVPQMEGVAKSDASEDRKLVLRGDFAINSRSDRKQSCGVATQNGSVSLINTILYPKVDGVLYTNYLNYLLKNYGFAEEFYRWGHGIVADLWTTRWQEMKNIILPIPPYQQQVSIYNELLERCATIDRLLASEEDQIIKINEYKRSIILDAVTRGRTPCSDFQNTGIDWMPTIPSHWKIVPLKSICVLKTGNTPPSQNRDYYNGDVYWYTPGDFTSDYIERSSRTITDYAVRDCGINLFPAGTTLLVGIGGTAGKVALIKSPGFSNQQITAIMGKGAIDSRYLYFLMSSSTKYLKDNALFTTLPIISNQYLGNFKICLPPKNEQIIIADYLETLARTIKKIHEIKTSKIDKLLELKKSLVYEYITGKKGVVK